MTEAEYVSARKACQKALWMKQALIDYDILLDNVPIMCDNKGAIDLSKNPVQHSRTKHIEIRHHFLRDNVQKGNISIKKVSSEDNIADILTKPLKRESFNSIRLGLGMMEHIPFEWRKIIFGMITIMGICHVKTLTLRGEAFDETRAKKRNNATTSGDYDEEREMEPRPGPTRETTPPLRPRSPGVRRQREKVVGFEEAPNREGSRAGRNAEGSRPSEIEARENGNSGMNLPLLLAAHLGRNESGQPMQSSLTSVYEGHQPSTNIEGISLLTTFINNGIPSYNGSMYPAATPSSNYPFYTQPMYAPPNMPMYPNPNPTGSFADPTGFITPFVLWIEDYPLPDGLKMPSHIGSYDGKGDPDNFLHLFEGAIRMQKWLMLVACHMFTYTLKDSAQIWWNSQKAGSMLNYEDLKAKFRSHFSQQKKFTKTDLAVHNIKQRKGESTMAFAARYTDDTLQILGLHEDRHHGHDTNDCRQLRSQIKEAVKSGQLSYLVKGIKKERAKSSENQRVEWKKDKGATPTKAPILMIRQEESYTKDNASEDFISRGREITFPLVTRGQQCTKWESWFPPSTELSNSTLPKESELYDFAWTHADMTGIPKTIMVKGKPFKTEHKLNEYSHIKLIKQKRRGLGPDRSTTACKEVEELTKVGILRKVKHQTWVANPVMVKKSD
ncbi:reverse transcriptase domain-containing protein [Tanacetum coccineum]